MSQSYRDRVAIEDAKRTLRICQVHAERAALGFRSAADCVREIGRLAGELRRILVEQRESHKRAMVAASEALSGTTGESPEAIRARWEGSYVGP